MLISRYSNQGFTLIEVLVTLVIVSVGMLALGSFYVTSINSEGVAQERIAAIHLAEQLVEDWQKTDVRPTPDCTLPGGSAAGQLALGTKMLQCKANNGLSWTFDILIDENQAMAPIPPDHVNNPAAGGAAATANQTILGGLVDTAGNPVNVRFVKILWKHKGAERFVFLTNMRQF